MSSTYKGRDRARSDYKNGSKPKYDDYKPKNAGYKAGAKKPASTKTAKPAATKTILQPRPDWHAEPLPDVAGSSDAPALPTYILEKVQSYAESLLDDETNSYAANNANSSSHKFLSTIMTSGTWGDKVSALTLLVQESPIHNTKAFENLLNLAGKRNRGQALMALGALKDLLGAGVVLPADRKLRTFANQPALAAAFSGVKSWTQYDSLPNGLEKIHLMMWIFEDWLKKTYFEVLKLLETWCNDEVEFSRMRALTFVFELLREKPEQEENLLRLLVNKLGDSDKKIASRASHLLLQLQTTHPSMKSVIIQALESDVLLRPGQKSLTKYYAIITLNQTVLQTSEPAVANKLLDVYFSLFVVILTRSKHQSQVTKPVGDDKQTGGESRKRKREQHTKNVKLQDQDRSDQELEDKIIAQVLTGINRAFPFSAADSATFETHLDTMFRITHSANFNTSVQALMLIQQISSTHHISTDRFLRTLYESLLDPRLLKSSKQTMYLNLLYRSLKTDVSLRRVKAFVKRILQVIVLHEPAFACAALYLVAELCIVFPSVKSMLDTPETAEEDEEEVFRDVPDADDTAATAPPPTISTVPSRTAYDGRKRDPEHSNAERTCMWELPPWRAHFHPSVSLFATRLLTAGPAPPKPDPATHTLMHFLDRFAYRNPRANAAAPRGTSLMQPALGAANAADTLLGASNTTATPRQPLNSEAFWSRKAADVAADEVFFHRYFAETAPRRVERRRERKAARGEEDEVDDVDDEGGEAGGEDEIWRALVGSRPELDVGDDEDEDSDEGDLDMGDSDSEDGGEGDGGVDIEGSDDGLADLLADEDGEDVDIEDDDEEDEAGSALFSSDDEDAGAAATAAAVPTLEDVRARRGDAKGGARKRRKLHLPTFASADDYAKLLDADDDDAPDGGY